MFSGVIQRYFEDIKMGTVHCTGERSYIFKRPDWLSSSEPKTGMKVTFELEKDRPVRIQLVE